MGDLEAMAGVFRHYKGGRYRVVAVAETHHHNGDKDVVYVSLTTGSIVTRPLEKDSRDEDSWSDIVDWPDGEKRPRFVHEKLFSIEAFKTCEAKRWHPPEGVLKTKEDSADLPMLRSTSRSHVFRNRADKFVFEDETGDLHGPYDSLDDAGFMLDMYCRGELDGQPPPEDETSRAHCARLGIDVERWAARVRARAERAAHPAVREDVVG